MRRKGPKRRRRQSGAMLLFAALGIAVLILGFLIRRLTQPATIRYVVPPHPPATVVAPPQYSPDGVAPPPAAGPDTQNNGAAAPMPPRATDAAASNPGEQLTPLDRQRLDTLIRRKLNQ